MPLGVQSSLCLIRMGKCKGESGPPSYSLGYSPGQISLVCGSCLRSAVFWLQYANSFIHYGLKLIYLILQTCINCEHINNFEIGNIVLQSMLLSFAIKLSQNTYSLLSAG